MDYHHYDDLNRLTAMTINGTTAATYGYNTIGNMTSKVESYTGMLNPTSLTLTYPNAGQPRPHAVTSTSGSASLALVYDADGNLATQGTAVYTYDAENRLKTRTATTGAQSYAYDAGGTLVKRYNAADGSWTAYVGGLYEKNSDGSTVKYYRAAGRTVAMRKSGVVSYLLADHLGSTVGVLDASGALIATQSYWPYGATRATTGVLATDKQYTGQHQESGDPALGLYNYKARFYSTVLRRFVSADTVADGLNRYEYVHDNPLRYTDPSGHCFTFGVVHLACSPDGQDAVNILYCALTCGDNWLGAIARFGIGQQEFWGSVFRLDGNGFGAVNAKLLTAFVGVARADVSAWQTMPRISWNYFADAVHVSAQFLELSLHTLVSGNGSWIGDVSTPNMMDAKRWWHFGLGLGGPIGVNGSTEGDKFRHLVGANSTIAEQAWGSRTLEVAAELGGPLVVNRTQLAWSGEQLNLLGRSGNGYNPPYVSDDSEHYERDMRCILGLPCGDLPDADIPDINFGL